MLLCIVINIHDTLYMNVHEGDDHEEDRAASATTPG